MVQQLKIKSIMEDNRYLEQAAALLDKAKEAGEIIGVVLATTGRKPAFKTHGSDVAILNCLIGFNDTGDDFEGLLATAVVAMMLTDKDFAHKIDLLRSCPDELMKHLKECSDKLDAELAADAAGAEGTGDEDGDEDEKEESHDSEEAA